MIKSLIALASCVAISVSLLACGAASDDPSGDSAKKKPSGFIASAERICREANKELEDVHDLVENATTPQEFDQGERDGVRLLTKLATNLDALQEPAKQSKAVTALVASIESSAARIKSEGYSVLNREYDDNFKDVRAAAEAVGLADCKLV